MAAKTWACPNCTCLNMLPQVDDDGLETKCIACKFDVRITKTGKLDHRAIAPRS